jgi:gliding motility-associated-like protein
LAGSTTFITPYLNVTTTYYTQARDTAFNCLSAARTPVTAFIKPITVPEISGPAHACAGSGVQDYATQAGMLNYQWYVTPGGQIISGQGTNAISVQWLSQGNESVVVLVTDPDGCIPPSAIIHVAVEVPPGPAGAISGPSPLCSGTTQAVFSVTPVPGAFYYVWTLPPGMGIIAGWGSDSVTVSIPAGSGSGYLSVYAVNSCGDGLASPPFLLVIHDLPTVSAGKGDTLCQGTSFSISQATAENTGSLRWSTSGQGTFSDPFSLNPVYTPAIGDTGRVILTLLGYGLAPCPDDSSSLVLYYNEGPHADAGENGSVCEGSSYLLSSSSAVNYMTLLWTSSGSGTFSNPGILHPLYQPSSGDIQNGTVTLTLRLQPKPGCSEVLDSMRLEIGKAPTAAAGKGGVTCGGNPFRVQNAQAANYSHISWTNNGKGQLSGDTTLEPVYTPPADESEDVILTLHVAGILPCSDSAVSLLTLTVYTGLTVTAGPDQLIPDSSSTFLGSSVKGGSGQFTYNWEPASLLVDPSQPDPQTQILTKDTLFILMVKDLNSICQGKDSMRVRIQANPPKPVENCILVHNVITPNGDGLNDKLIIDCIESYPDNSIQFFTRWGDRVRTYDRYDNKDVAWDGKNERGEPLPDGTYYYVLTVKGIGTLTGWVFIRDGAR